jgi:hypothetical protein
MEPEPSLVSPLRLLGVGAAVVVVDLLLWWLAANTFAGPFEDGGDDAYLWMGLLMLMLLVGVVAVVSALIWLCVNFVRRLI